MLGLIVTTRQGLEVVPESDVSRIGPLAVHPTLRDFHLDSDWSISHIDTGMLVAWQLPNVDAARACAQQLTALYEFGFRTAEEHDPAAFKGLPEIVQSHGGRVQRLPKRDTAEGR